MSENAEIRFEETHVHITYQDLSLSLELSNPIIVEESSKTTTAKKIEIKLKKQIDGTQWMKVEKAGEAKLLATSTVS